MELNKHSDELIISTIKKLQNGEGTEEELDFWLSNILSEFSPGISDLIFHSEKNLSPEEILKICKEKNDTILL